MSVLISFNYPTLTSLGQLSPGWRYWRTLVLRGHALSAVRWPGLVHAHVHQLVLRGLRHPRADQPRVQQRCSSLSQSQGFNKLNCPMRSRVSPLSQSEDFLKLNWPMMSRVSPVSQSEVFKRWTVQWGAQFPNSYCTNVQCTNVQYVFWENIEPIFYTFYLKTEHIHIVKIIVTVHYSIILYMNWSKICIARQTVKYCNVQKNHGNVTVFIQCSGRHCYILYDTASVWKITKKLAHLSVCDHIIIISISRYKWKIYWKDRNKLTIWNFCWKSCPVIEEKVNTPKILHLKGQCHEIFDLYIFS